ncbi:Protein HOS4 [Cytospora mali]|uniref:Protein HOS4 n=1 Tax=Cytospora mali TaxID=578113 RepID=A0A194VLM4_CYTMA|nr:Protein HOS4 [Valsa mali]
MDAQNAAESAATKPAASTPASPRPCNNNTTTEPDLSNKPASSAPSLNKSPLASAPPSSTPLRVSKSSGTVSHQQGQDDDAGADNSEAETIVLGTSNDGSPDKSRKVIKREDGSDRDERRTVDDSPSKRKSSDGKHDSHGPKEGSSGSNSLATDIAKRKRLMDHPRRSESESVRARSPKPSSKEREPKDKDNFKAKSAEKLLPHKRKVPKADSEDDADNENHKLRRQRISASIDASSTPRLLHKERDPPKLTSSKTNVDHVFSPRRRSTSPHPRTHRRSASTQVVSQSSSSGLSHKKKRVPPPLTTDYHSDESSTSGSPHIRSSTIRGLATPATAESAMSSAKSTAHKKHVDAHGQTQLAKACSRGEYENVKRRLGERPQDLNFPDYAGNTPLQIAAINGYDDIVKLLVEAGCDIDCVNHDKDTPLLDAVDNGHLEVVKVLLEAGVNPRKANVNGEEPLDRVDDDLDNAEEIRAALTEARKKMGDRRRTSEEQQDHLDTRSYGPDSPRRSPAVNEPPTSTRRAASSRSHKLSNQVLYMHMDDKTLRQAAGRGDVETVERILQVRDNFDDAEAMVAAARGGHETVMNLLLALGNANPDPSPVSAWPPDIATPILAAIGQENIRVISLLLAQSNFDPTRRFRGETYHEIAQKRQGPNWKEEEHLLKGAYDEYKRTHRDSLKRSPNRREQEAKRGGRTEPKDDSVRALKRKATSPTRDGHRVTSGKSRTGEKEARATSSVGTKNDELTSPKRGPGRPRKEDRALPTIAISEGEASPPTARSSNKPKRPDMDPASFSSEGETKPRKRLMSGRDLKEQREKIRRASMVSTSSSLREPPSPRDPRHDELHELPTEKYHDRAKALKRDGSRDRLSVSGDNPGKRSRISATPDHGSSEKEGEPPKRRRLEGDKKDRLPKPSSSPDRSRKSTASRDAPAASRHDDKPTRKHDESEKIDSSRPRKSDSASDHSRDSGKSASSEKSIHVKSEDADIVMKDADHAQDEERKLRAAREKEDEKRRRAELEAKKKKEAEERRRREEDEARRRQAEAKKREEEEREKKRLEEEERKQREEEARKQREEAERLQKEEEERRKEDEERLRLEKEREEVERRKREEQERIRKEKEAAEQARRKREEEERKEQERREREEQRRALREAELRRIREEQERARLDKLPAFLRWLDRGIDTRTPETAKRFRILTGVRYDSIRPETAGTEEGRELWIMNTQAALLLGESDLRLSRFPGWDHVPASEAAKYVILGKKRPSCGLIDVDEWDLGRQLPGYYFGKEPELLSFKEKQQLQEESKLKFRGLDLFFVKLSDLMFFIPNIPHLRNLEIVVTYEEIPETVEQYEKGEYPSRWKNDPDAERYMGFCPRNKYYVNGQLVREGKVDINNVSKTPWPEQRVPRDGLTAVSPTNPNYVRFAKEQGLSHLLSGLRTPPMTTVAQSSPNRLFSQRTFQGPNDGLSPPPSESTATANGDGLQPRSSTADHDKTLVNGHNSHTELLRAGGETSNH